MMINAFSTLRRAVSKVSFCLPFALATIPAGQARAADPCADMNIRVSKDQPVDHPDFYNADIGLSTPP